MSRLARSLDTLRNQVWSAWPGTQVDWIGDLAHAARSSDHNPNPQGVVCAVDIHGVAASPVFESLVAGRDPRIKYLIHKGIIVSSVTSPWVRRRYTGSNPHDTHVHVSVGVGASGNSVRSDLYDDPNAWAISFTDTLGDIVNILDIKAGDSGDAVEALQRMLLTIDKKSLPQWGADGSWGEETSRGLGAILHNQPRNVTKMSPWAWELLVNRYTVARARAVVRRDVPAIVAAAVGEVSGSGVDVDALVKILDKRYVEYGESVTIDR